MGMLNSFHVRHVMFFFSKVQTREGDVLKSEQPTDATVLVPDWLSPGFWCEALS